MRWIPDRLDAEDVSQNILIRVCENITGLKKPEAFGGWLNAIIKNEINRHYRVSSYRGSVVSIDEYFDAVSPGALIEEDIEYLPSEYVLREEERRVIMSLVDKLPERQLEAVLLHYFEGMSITETAEAMNVTQPAVSRYLTLAKEKVKAEIQRHAVKKNAVPDLSTMAVGSLLTQAMWDEAATLPYMNRVFVERVVDIGLSKSGLAKAARKVSGRFAQDLAIGTALVMLAVTAVIGFWLSGRFTETEAAPVATEGKIIFTDADMSPVTVNPVHLDAWARNSRGELTAQRWWITRSDSEEMLSSGKALDADDVLEKMIGDGEVGQYTLYLIVKDAAGCTYTLHKQFWIKV